MRTADIFGSNVYDQSGRQVGHVHDVRVVEEVPPGDVDGPRLRLDGLIVGKGALLARSGYAYGDMQGPWLVVQIMKLFRRRAYLVPWDVVETFERDRVVTSARLENLPHPGEHRDDE